MITAQKLLDKIKKYSEEFGYQKIILKNILLYHSVAYMREERWVDRHSLTFFFLGHITHWQKIIIYYLFS